LYFYFKGYKDVSLAQSKFDYKRLIHEIFKIHNFVFLLIHSYFFFLGFFLFASIPFSLIKNFSLVALALDPEAEGKENRQVHGP